MAQTFKETAHLHTDLDKYGEGYDRIFKKSQEPQKDENQKIKDLAKSIYQELQGGQDTEGFPESSSFIYGFIKGYQSAKEGK